MKNSLSPFGKYKTVSQGLTSAFRTPVKIAKGQMYDENHS